MNGELRSLVQDQRFGDAFVNHCLTDMDYCYINSHVVRVDRTKHITKCANNFAHFVMIAHPQLTLTPLHQRAIIEINRWANMPMHTQHKMLNMPVGSGKTMLATLAAAWLVLRLSGDVDGGDVTVASLRGVREPIRHATAAHLSGLVEPNAMKAGMRVTRYGRAALMFSLHGEQPTGLTRNFLVADEFPNHPIADVYRWRQSVTLGTWDGEIDTSRSLTGICTDVVDLRHLERAEWLQA